MAVKIHLAEILGKQKMTQLELSKKQVFDPILSTNYIGNLWIELI